MLSDLEYRYCDPGVNPSGFIRDESSSAWGGGAETFAAGHRLAIINEAPADATLADLSITILGKRT
jgi:hypothetical protein